VIAMPFDIDPTYLFYVVITLAVIFAVEAFYLFASYRLSYKRQTNARLAAMAGAKDREQVLVELRRQRGLSSEGRYLLPLLWFNKLLLQSGAKLGVVRLFLICFLLSLGGFAISVFGLKNDPLISGIASAAAGCGLPLLFLMFKRRRRQKKFAEQLPDSIDIIVRSLRAGHPVPVALGMVGREMADPIGSEFGMALDELTYGLELERALVNMTHRVGQEDLSLVVTAVSLQSSTGGNLSEVLTNLSYIIRERFKLRRKVRSLSAEGRISAYGLSALPVIMFLILSVIAPKYYGDIWNEPITQPALLATACWAMFGMGIMYKMVNFKV
jgi:tight adherence protein B